MVLKKVIPPQYTRGPYVVIIISLEAVVSDRAAAVAILKGKGSLIGLVRMVQASAGTCVIEAALDKVPSGGRYLLSIHQLGDVSLGGLRCEGLGEAFQAVVNKGG